MKVLLAGYLTALMFWFQVSLGSLGILLIHNITGGRWGVVLRPHLLRTLPTLYVLALGFLPVILFMPTLYPWVHPDTRPPVEEFALRTTLMNPTFFAIRSIVYLMIWVLLARTARSQLKAFSGGGLIALLFSVSFSAMDWIMTLDPQWVSTGFGIVFIAGCLVGGFAFMTIVALTKEQKGERSLVWRRADQPLLIDLGNLLLMSVLFWAYMEYMQYLVIWSGQIPKELGWYQVRSQGGWRFALVSLALFHFAIPFFLLLFRAFKQSPRQMLVLASMLLASQWLDCLLLVAPSLDVNFFWSVCASLFWCGLLGLVWILVFNRRERQGRPTAYPGLAAEVGR